MCLGAKLTPVDIPSYGSPFKHVNVPVCAPKLIKVPGSKHVKFYVTDTVDCLIKGLIHPQLVDENKNVFYSEAFTMELN